MAFLWPAACVSSNPITPSRASQHDLICDATAQTTFRSGLLLCPTSSQHEHKCQYYPTSITCLHRHCSRRL